MNDLPAIIGGLSLLVGAVFTGLIGLGQRRTRIDQETLDELDDYHRWHPRVRRALVLLRATIADSPDVTEPAEVEDLIRWPPPKPRHNRRDELTDDHQV